MIVEIRVIGELLISNGEIENSNYSEMVSFGKFKTKKKKTYLR